MERDIGSIVNEVIRTISSQAFYFSFRKIFEKAKINKQNKNKQTLNNKGNTKTSKRAKVVCFAFWCFFYAQNFFVKKKKKLAWNCSDNLIYYTTEVYILCSISSSVHFFIRQKLLFGEIPWLMARHATPLVTLFFGVTMILTGCHVMPVVI